ncbi:MAG: OsmC family protein [Candidatus Delongbacteria bacterium]
MMKIKAVQTGDLSFEIDQSGHKYTLDTTVENGGSDKGPTPKPLLLSALMGCSGMDIASILKKMHVDHKNFSMTAEGRSAEDYPQIYEEIFVEYIFRGSEDIDGSKLKRAVELSLTKYCPVAAMLSKSSGIIYKIFLNDRMLYEERL